MSEEGYKPRDVARKFGRNDLDGRKQLREATVKEIKELPDWWRRCPNAALMFTQESEEEIERITSSVLALAEKYDIELWLGGRDIPYHVIVQAGTAIPDKKNAKQWEEWERMTNDEKEARWKSGRELFQNSKDLHEKAAVFNGLKIPFKYLSINGDTITLNSVEIPDELKTFRADAAKLLEDNSFEAPNMDNILHLTIARIKRLPDSEAGEKLQGFKQDLIALRHEISLAEVPPILEVDHIHVGGPVVGRRRDEL